MRTRSLGLALVILSSTACDEAPKVDPAQVEAKLQSDLKAASAWVRNNKSEDARRSYTAILQTHPNQPEALTGLARIHLADGKLDEALTFVDRAIAADASDAAAFVTRGEILTRQAKPNEAAAAFGRAFELAPEKSDYGLQLGIALKQSESYAEAERVLRKVAELDPMVRFVYTELGEVLREQKRLDEALKTYMKALSTYASDAKAHAGAALVYEARGDLRHALDEWSTYIRMDCCSDYSEGVARKHLVELQAKSNAPAAGTSSPPTPAG